MTGAVALRSGGGLVLPAAGETVLVRGPGGADRAALVTASGPASLVLHVAGRVDGGLLHDLAWVGAVGVRRAGATPVGEEAGAVVFDVHWAIDAPVRFLRRAAPLVTVTARLSAVDLYGRCQVVADALVRDVGVGGVGLVLADPVDAGEHVDLTLAAGGATLAAAPARVAHVSTTPGGLVAGCAFASIATGAAVIESLVAAGVAPPALRVS